ncbi:hypothetical protein RCC89_05765 [Cytophagaceae bacterium ABcell3]|nr:hypothetical protein RCC89_05765 [Cytophagaceae bacterium ABcell3]
MLKSIFSGKSFCLTFVLAMFFMVASTSCGKNNYPCPAYDSNAADLDMFDEEGDLKGKRKGKAKKGGRVDRSTGLINKKNPKKIRKKRKRRL